MHNRLEISTPLHKFFRYLQASPNIPKPLTLEIAQEELDQLSLFRLEILLGGLGPDQKANEIQQDLQLELAVMRSMNPWPLLIDDFLAHHHLVLDAWRN